MAVKIHPTAVVQPGAELEDDVEVGPLAVIESGARLGRGCHVMARAFVGKHSTLGEECEVHIGAIVGHEPQHREWHGEVSYLRAGDRNIFREYVTVHRGSRENSSTVIGNDNLFMVLAHLGHDCQVGNNVNVANSCFISGHVTIEDQVFMSAGAAVHQFARIGRLAFVRFNGRCSKDVPPYCIMDGIDEIIGLNLVGLKRAFPNENNTRSQIKEAYKVLFRSHLNTSQALGALRSKGDWCPEVQHLIQFVETSERGICRATQPIRS